MIEWLFSNIDKVLIAIGAAVVLFLPQIKAQIAALQSGGGDNPADQQKPSQNGCNCCCPEEPEYEDTDKSVWVVRTMETRAYCLDHKLDEGVKLCEELVGVLVSARPKKTIAVVTKEV